MHRYIYLCGSVRKGSDDERDDASFWSREDEELIRRTIEPHSVELLSPERSRISRNDYIANFGCDLYLVSLCDLILCDARTRKGIGVGAELMFAHQYQIPVITIAPRETHYRRSHVPDVFGETLQDWIHPFIAGLSDYIVEDLAGAAQLIKRSFAEGNLAKTASVDAAIKYFGRLYNARTIQQS